MFNSSFVTPLGKQFNYGCFACARSSGNDTPVSYDFFVFKHPLKCFLVEFNFKRVVQPRNINLPLIDVVNFKRNASAPSFSAWTMKIFSGDCLMLLNQLISSFWSA